jgi:hypothetical protein
VFREDSVCYSWNSFSDHRYGRCRPSGASDNPFSACRIVLLSPGFKASAFLSDFPSILGAENRTYSERERTDKEREDYLFFFGLWADCAGHCFLSVSSFAHISACTSFNKGVCFLADKDRGTLM